MGKYAPHLLSLCMPLMALVGAFSFVSGVAAQTANTNEPAPTKNAAEDIQVKLQVPLPFIKLSDEGRVGNLQDYIQGGYRFLIGAGSVFAVVMIIIAGYQWIIAGGAADKINAAKRRILNASVGLMLALLSFIILNAITPRLVELRLPVVEPIPALEFDDKATCASEPFIQEYVGSHAGETVYLSDQSGIAQGTLEGARGLGNAECGVKYSVTAGKDKKAAQYIGTCTGGACSTGESCILGICTPSYLAGTIGWSENNALFSNAYVEEVHVYGICTNGKAVPVDYYPVKQLRAYYTNRYKLWLNMYEFAKKEILFDPLSVAFKKNPEILTNLPTGAVPTADGVKNPFNSNIVLKESEAFGGGSALIRTCGGVGTLEGFAVAVIVNDDQGTGIVGASDDDLYALKKNCIEPVAADPNAGSAQKKFAFKYIDWTDSQVISDAVYGVDEFKMQKGVLPCNISINRSKFPAYNTVEF